MEFHFSKEKGIIFQLRGAGADRGGTYLDGGFKNEGAPPHTPPPPHPNQGKPWTYIVLFW